MHLSERQITGPSVGLEQGLREARGGAGGLEAVHALAPRVDLARAGLEAVDQLVLLLGGVPPNLVDRLLVIVRFRQVVGFGAGELAHATARALGEVDEDREVLAGFFGTFAERWRIPPVTRRPRRQSCRERCDVPCCFSRFWFHSWIPRLRSSAPRASSPLSARRR